MLHTTPQERLALTTVALLLLAGAGARWAAAGAPDAAWVDSAGAPADTPLGERPPAAEVRREVERERIRDAPLAVGERIDPDRASVDELQRLPRVGPALAARIVAHRETVGPIRTLADLDAVQGVGPALLRSLEPHLSLRPAPSRPRAAPGGTRLDLNRATAAELEALPGIGPSLATRLVEWRNAHGPFRSLDQMEEVPGIGPALRRRLEPHLRVGR